MSNHQERPRLTKKGNWIIVTKFIPVDIPIRPFSIFFAKADVKEEVSPYSADWSYLGDDELVEMVYAKISTEFGTVKLRPDEYNVLTEEAFSEYLSTVKQGDFSINFYAETGKGRFKAQSKKLTEAVFYCRSRGIPFVEAILMCTGLVTSQNVFYLKIHESGLGYFFYEDEVDRFLEEERIYTEKHQEYNEEGELELVP